MITQIYGLHHVTSLASDARTNNGFFTNTLGLRRVKKTVNFDAPDVYHLYYGNEKGDAGSAMTYFPFQNAARGTRGTGEVGVTNFSIPEGTRDAWAVRLALRGVQGLEPGEAWGAKTLVFQGPDGDHFSLIESPDTRTPWTGNGVSAEMAIRGFHSATMRLQDDGATIELLTFMGYEVLDRKGNITRMHVPHGEHATVIEIETLPGAARARQSAGSVHHLAFGVKDRAAQLEVRKALVDTGYQVTPPIDRDYFWAIYFRTPGGVLFEIATDEPGFERDEQLEHLGEALMLPTQHAHLRAALETHLQKLED